MMERDLARLIIEDSTHESSDLRAQTGETAEKSQSGLPNDGASDDDLEEDGDEQDVEPSPAGAEGSSKKKKKKRKAKKKKVS